MRPVEERNGRVAGWRERRIRSIVTLSVSGAATVTHLLLWRILKREPSLTRPLTRPISSGRHPVSVMSLSAARLSALLCLPACEDQASDHASSPPDRRPERTSAAEALERVVSVLSSTGWAPAGTLRAMDVEREGATSPMIDAEGAQRGNLTGE